MTDTTAEYSNLTDRLTRVEVKVDMLLDRATTGHEDHEVRLRALEQRVDPSNVDHETRLRRLERSVWSAAGAAAAGGGVVGSVVVWLLTGGVG